MSAFGIAIIALGSYGCGALIVAFFSCLHVRKLAERIDYWQSRHAEALAESRKFEADLIKANQALNGTLNGETK